MNRQARRRLIEIIAERLQVSARTLSKDGMTGISDARAEHLAIDVVDLLRHEPALVSELLEDE